VFISTIVEDSPLPIDGRKNVQHLRASKPRRRERERGARDLLPKFDFGVIGRRWIEE
jgi:hypothetical protein